MTNEKENYDANEIHNPNDKAFKDSFSVPEIAQTYFNNFFDKKLAKKLDYGTLKLLPTSYITPELVEFFSDLVWHCKTKEGIDLYITFLFEHKTDVPKVPQIQLLQYLAGGYNQQYKDDETLTLIVPIVVYHGTKKWHYRPFQSFFKNFDEDFLIYLPKFDYWLTNLQNYTDEVLKGFQMGFLTKIFLAFKHYKDTKYINQEFVSLLTNNYNDTLPKEKYRMLFKTFLLYLQHISTLKGVVLKKELEKLNEPLKSEAMTTYQSIIEEGIEIPVINAYKDGKTIQQIVDFMKLPFDKVKFIIDGYLKSQGQN